MSFWNLKLRRERRIRFVRKHMLIRSENQTPSRSRFPLLRFHELLMTFTVISNLNTSTLTSLLGKQLINENTQGAQKMAKFIISFCKGIFELFHILVFPSMENCWIRKGNISLIKKYTVEDTNSSTATVMLCKIALFYVNINKSIIVCRNSSYADISD